MADLHPFRVGTFSPTEETRQILRTLSLQIPDPSFTSLVTTIVSSLIKNNTNNNKDTDLTQHSSLTKLNNPILATNIIRILQTYFIDFAKCGTPGTSIRTSLEEAGLSSTKVNTMVDIYDQSMPNIRKALENSGKL